MVIRSPMGVWGKQIVIPREQTIHTTISHPELVTERPEGVLIHIKQSLHEPLTIIHKGTGKVSVHIMTERNVEATIIEQITGCVVHEIHIDLAPNSGVSYGLIQEGTYEGKKKAIIASDARMTWFELNQGTVHSRISSDLAQNASVRSNSIFLGAPGDHIDFGSKATHIGPDSSSQLLTKGVLKSSQAVYDGVLDIKGSAPRTSAHQREDCLLLDTAAEIKAAPQLFIDNNDVQCSHACTTSKPDEALAFYLRSRGIPLEVAQAMLIKAFVWPVLEALPKHLSCWLEKHVEEQLLNGGL